MSALRGSSSAIKGDATIGGVPRTWAAKNEHVSWLHDQTDPCRFAAVVEMCEERQATVADDLFESLERFIDAVRAWLGGHTRSAGWRVRTHSGLPQVFSFDSVRV